jgi:hypothetical protein
MAHFAELNDNNVVERVIVVSNEELLDNNVESEIKGIAFCKSLFGANTQWVQTSYNRNMRKNFAGINYIYDPIADHFFAPQPYPSWVLNNNAIWEAPIPMPEHDPTTELPVWNEETQSWEL